MAKDIGGMREPGDSGSKLGQIETPMSSTNIGRKNTPSILTYKDVIDTGEKSSGSGSIMGPGTKNKY